MVRGFTATVYTQIYYHMSVCLQRNRNVSECKVWALEIKAFSHFSQSLHQWQQAPANYVARTRRRICNQFEPIDTIAHR